MVPRFDGSLKFLAVTLIVSLLVHSVQGFFPTTWKENIFGYGGTSHVQQTKMAFADLAAMYFPTIGHLTKSMTKARDSIADANADVDKDQDHSALHCDGENLDAVQVRLQTLHRQVIDQLGTGNPSDARESLGQALHTLQDFYAHSNWVELGNSAPSSILGRSSTISHAGPLDPTCVGCLSHSDTDDTVDICLNCPSNTVGSLLTSGYYAGEDSTPLPGVAKCHHGGFTDGSIFQPFAIGPSNPGINKDSLYGGWSPHYFLHNQAVAISIAATEQYIDDIQDVISHTQLRQLFGVGPTFAFVIDTTGSMGDIITTVQDASIQIVNQRLGTPDEPSTYIISPFNDPSSGPVTSTSDVAVFKSSIQSLFASGGGDCPELSIGGMVDAANVMDDESSLFMFTDAAAKDFDRASELIDICVGRNIAIYIFKFDSDCDDGVPGGSKVKRVDSGSDRVYGLISLATGGDYRSLPRNEAANVTSLVDALTLSNNNYIVKIIDSLTLSVTTRSYFVPVDSGMTQVSMSLRFTTFLGSVTMVITDPVGAPVGSGAVGVSIVTFSDGTFVSIKSPLSGSWKVQVAGTGNFTLDATGISPLHFSSFRFATLAGRQGHTGYFPISSSPPFNVDIAAIADMDGPWSNAQFSFRLPDGTKLNILSMIQGTGIDGDPPKNEFFTTMRLTPVDKYIYVDGTDSMGTFYTRVIPTVISPIFSNDSFPVSNVTAPSSSSPSASSSLASSAIVSSTTCVSVYRGSLSPISSSSTTLWPTASSSSIAAPTFFTSAVSSSSNSEAASSLLSAGESSLGASTSLFTSSGLSIASSTLASSAWSSSSECLFAYGAGCSTPCLITLTSASVKPMSSLKPSSSSSAPAASLDSAVSASTSSVQSSSLSNTHSSLSPSASPSSSKYLRLHGGVPCPTSGSFVDIPVATVPSSSMKSQLSAPTSFHVSNNSPSNLDLSRESSTSSINSAESTPSKYAGGPIGSSAILSSSTSSQPSSWGAAMSASSSSAAFSLTAGSSIHDGYMRSSSRSADITASLPSGNSFHARTSISSPAANGSYSYVAYGSSSDLESDSVTSSDFTSSIPVGSSLSASSLLHEVSLVSGISTGPTSSTHVSRSTGTSTSTTYTTSVVSGSGLSTNVTTSIYHYPFLSALTPVFTLSTTTTFLTDSLPSVASNDVVTTTLCPVTITSTISGFVYYSVTHSSSSITVTLLSTARCDAENCKVHRYPSTPLSVVPPVTYSLFSSSENGQPPITITEIIIITTSSCPVTVGTSVSSGSTSYEITYSVTTQTLTSTTTLPCGKCGPKTVTLTSVYVPSVGTPLHMKSNSPLIGPSQRITLAVKSIPPKSVTPIFLPLVPSQPACYGSECYIPSSLGPPSSLTVFRSPPPNPTYPAPSGTPAASSVLECHGLGCPILTSPDTLLPPQIFSTGVACSDAECPGVLLPPHLDGIATTLLNIPSPLVSPGCGGPECSGNLKPPSSFPTSAGPGNTTFNVPPVIPSVITYTGGIESNLKLFGKTVALGLIISVFIGIVML